MNRILSEQRRFNFNTFNMSKNPFNWENNSNVKYEKLRESPSPPGKKYSEQKNNPPPPEVPKRNVVQRPPDRSPKPKREKDLIDFSSK